LKPPSFVWFQLSDSNGNPYKGTDVDFLKSVPDLIVGELRDAVKAKFFDSYLQNVAASDLKIYKNKSAFESGEVPLKSSMVLKRFGNSDDDALIVVVPATALISKIKFDSNHINGLFFY
jgi:hypothetical protein